MASSRSEQHSRRTVKSRQGHHVRTPNQTVNIHTASIFCLRFIRPFTTTFSDETSTMKTCYEQRTRLTLFSTSTCFLLFLARGGITINVMSTSHPVSNTITQSHPDFILLTVHSSEIMTKISLKQNGLFKMFSFRQGQLHTANSMLIYKGLIQYSPKIMHAQELLFASASRATSCGRLRMLALVFCEPQELLCV